MATKSGRTFGRNGQTAAKARFYAMKCGPDGPLGSNT